MDMCALSGAIPAIVQADPTFCLMSGIYAIATRIGPHSIQLIKAWSSEDVSLISDQGEGRQVAHVQVNADHCWEHCICACSAMERMRAEDLLRAIENFHSLCSSSKWDSRPFLRRLRGRQFSLPIFILFIWAYKSHPPGICFGGSDGVLVSCKNEVLSFLRRLYSLQDGKDPQATAQHDLEQMCTDEELFHHIGYISTMLCWHAVEIGVLATENTNISIVSAPIDRKTRWFHLVNWYLYDASVNRKMSRIIRTIKPDQPCHRKISGPSRVDNSLGSSAAEIKICGVWNWNFESSTDKK